MSQPVTSTDRVVPASESFSSEVGDEAVVLNQATGRYYGLDEVGARAWRLFSSGATFGEVHSDILGEYDVASEVLWQDLQDLVSKMRELGIVTVQPVADR